MTGWRKFDDQEEAACGRSLWVHRSGTDQVELITCDEQGKWQYSWGGDLYSNGFLPDLCHDLEPPALPAAS